MRYRLFALVFLGCLFTNTQAAELAIGKPVAAFSIKTLDGKLISSASTKGKILVINLWATWCEPCRKEMPALEAFYRQYQNRGVEVIGISLDDRSDRNQVNTVMQSFSFPAGLAQDADIDAFGRIWRVPVTFVIDKNGLLRRNGWNAEPVVDMSILEKTVLPLLNTAPKAD